MVASLVFGLSGLKSAQQRRCGAGLRAEKVDFLWLCRGLADELFACLGVRISMNEVLCPCETFHAVLRGFEFVCVDP